MSDASPLVRLLLREALEHEGRIPLARIAQEVVPVAGLRELARRHALNPKGYRIEKAPPAKLVPLLVDVRRPDVVEELVEVLVSRLAERPEASSPEPDTARLAELEARLARRDAELERTKGELARCRTQAARHREREADLLARVDAAEQRVAGSRAEVEALRRQGPSHVPASAAMRDLERRIHELERELETSTRAEEELRRMLALRHGQVRHLEEQVAELRERLPKGRKKPVEKPEAPRLSDHFRLPHFTPAFYKSLDGFDRRQVEKVVQAALLFCTEGPSYPGLEVKQIEGQDLWSLRASLKLRVYFVFRDDGAVEFVAAADREDQHTTLRRLKER